MKDIKLTDLISVDILQQIQDGFSEYTGMAALTTDSDGIPVTEGSGFTHFCMDLTRKSKLGCQNCEACDRDGALLTLKNGHASVYECHAGLVDFAAPIMVEGKFFGSFIGGQVRTTDVDEEHMRRTATLYDIDPEEYIKAAKETKCLSKEEAEKAALFLEEIAAGFSKMAYESYTKLQESIRMENAAKSQADFVMNMSERIENSIVQWFTVVEKSIQDTEDDKTKTILTDMQSEGTEVRADIKNAIDYIRMAEQKLELLENDYNIHDFVAQLQTSLTVIAESNTVSNIPITLKVMDGTVDNLFGDSGRIGQLIHRIIRSILNAKKEGEIEIRFQTKTQSYATMLEIEILDFKTVATDEEVEHVQMHISRALSRAFTSENEDELWVTFVSQLIKKMSGKFETCKDGDVAKIHIVLPQLALE